MICQLKWNSHQKAVKKISNHCQNIIKNGQRHGNLHCNNNHLPFCLFVRVDSYDNQPYWFSNYTSSYVSLVANKYGDLVVGKLVHIYLKLFSKQHLYYQCAVLCKSQGAEKKIKCQPILIFAFFLVLVT